MKIRAALALCSEPARPSKYEGMRARTHPPLLTIQKLEYTLLELTAGMGFLYILGTTLRRGGWMMVSLRSMVLALTMTSTAAQAQGVLKVYNWIDYIDPEVVSDFERTTGAKVEYKVYTSSNEMLESLDRGDRYDVIVPTSDSVLRKLLNDQRLQPIHIDQLKNFANINPVLQILP
jgi:spermidine/putrescine-binding protein